MAKGWEVQDKTALGVNGFGYNILYDGRYVAHLYPDAEREEDLEALIELLRLASQKA